MNLQLYHIREFQPVAIRRNFHWRAWLAGMLFGAMLGALGFSFIGTRTVGASEHSILKVAQWQR